MTRAVVTKGTRLPMLFLLVLSPAIAELLTSSSPPAEFFSPFGLLMMVALYGSGAVLARELVVRWRKGWPSLLALGAAYGIVEEGLMVKSFFNPEHPDLGILSVYGRWAGINWVWAVELTMFHAVFSIALPILLTELAFPDQSRASWVGRLGFAILGLVLVSVSAFGLAFFPSRPPLLPYLSALLTVLLLIAFARILPGRPLGEPGAPASRPLRFWLLGFLATAAFFCVFWVLPYSGIHPILTVFMGLLLAVLVLFRWLHMSGNAAAWQNRHRLALASGALGFLIVLTPLIELDKTRPDNTAGMALVGLAMALFLLWLTIRVRKSEPLESGVKG